MTKEKQFIQHNGTAISVKEFEQCQIKAAKYEQIKQLAQENQRLKAQIKSNAQELAKLIGTPIKYKDIE